MATVAWGVFWWALATFGGVCLGTVAVSTVWEAGGGLDAAAAAGVGVFGTVVYLVGVCVGREGPADSLPPEAW